jgi:hypothetical protein
MSTTRLNNHGIPVELTLPDEGAVIVPIDATTTLRMIFTRPRGSNKTRTATFKTDGTDGIASYMLVSGDLDQTGTWRIQLFAVWPDGRNLLSSPFVLTVEA